MERALLACALAIAAVIGALSTLAFKLPVPRSFADWLTPFVGLAAVAQAFFAFWALRGLRHARVAADAATASLEHTIQTSERQLRAYVSITETSIDQLEVGQPIRVTVRAKNSGQTPAYDLVGFPGVTVKMSTDPIPLPTVPPELLPLGSRATVGSGSTISMAGRGAVDLSEATLAALRAGVARVHVHGYVAYSDAFGQDRRTSFSLSAHAHNPLGLSTLVRQPNGNEAT